MFAEVAAVLGICPILGQLDFPGEDDLVLKGALSRNRQRELSVVGRIAGALGCHAQRAAAQHFSRGTREIGAVDAAAEGHDHRAHVGENRPQLRRHSSQSSSSSSSASISSSSSSRSSSSTSSSSSSSSSSLSSSSPARSSSSGESPVTSRLDPHSGQLSRSPLSTSYSSTSISASHSGQMAIRSS